MKFSIFLLITIVFTFTNCSSPTDSEITEVGSLAKYGDNTCSAIDMPLEDLSEQEQEGLLFMHEEEKLARDVYLYFYEKYDAAIFSNIATSEQRHMDAVKLLIEKYELTDPVLSDVVGEFANSDLQELYNNLVAAGDVSLVEALKSGALIEEVDILDLINQIDNIADNEDILFVYNNLKNGSYNHLKGFVMNLSANGVTYEPQQLDSDLYTEIINSTSGNGYGNGSGVCDGTGNSDGNGGQRGNRGGRR